MQNVLSIQNISKSYGAVQALKNVTLDIPQGAVFGVLGPNGSGKTTLLGTILDVLKADGGSYSWFGGIPRDEARRKIGSLLETPNFYHYLSAYDNLQITAALRGKGNDDRKRVLEQVGLTERMHSKFKTFSLGMKQRLAIGAALIGSPDVLVLDEPTNGLDPAGIAEIRELIRTLNSQGTTIIIASHLLDEVEKVCTHVAILKRGDVLVSGPVDNTLRQEDDIEVAATDNVILADKLMQMPGVKDVKVGEKVLQIVCNEGIGTEHVNEYCITNGIVLTHLVLRKKSLEAKFMEITSK